MNINTVSANEVSFSAATAAGVGTVKGYRVERCYEGDRTASQVVSALMKVHDHREAAA